MDSALSIQALQRTGERLARKQPPLPRMAVYLVGGVSGMATGELAADRTTGDCDVMAVEPDDHWPAVADAAGEVAGEMGLKPDWLNRDCGMYAWQMPLSWKSRCRPLADYGPLRVMVPARVDLIAAKIMSAPKRPQDRDDLMAMGPTEAEIDEAERNLQRVESESEQGGCDPQRHIVRWLRTLRN
jgi:hypothetical protein